ncbi:LOW QUALITY PROTEIN: nuclear receptor-interacting protein 2 [Tachyglossus aculeatus]|uniref:LOW QUALITY PROTEIN: nuclear receptor-interacting protein 2 n=1 Tax=Tachyglossus aculeatus TaxID=9261 RepID=UPI0018F5CA13|nr:LOW QUALITY PROTEIN: nuclear receptor-interacting protein 2 [Tachyglossus aculeatus]
MRLFPTIVIDLLVPLAPVALTLPAAGDTRRESGLVGTEGRGRQESQAEGKRGCVKVEPLETKQGPGGRRTRPGLLSQQQHLKQATRFAHQDSADLLPLDSLKRLGTSKDLCGQQGLTAVVDTSIPHNLVSTNCFRHLEAVGRVVGTGKPSETPPHMEQLELQLGLETVVCSAMVIGDDSPELSLGLRMHSKLQAFKCCIDLESGILRLRGPCPDLPFLSGPREPGPPPPPGVTGP